MLELDSSWYRSFVLVCLLTQAPTFQRASTTLPSLECFLLILAYVFDKPCHDYFFVCVMIIHHVLIPQHKRQTESPQNTAAPWGLASCENPAPCRLFLSPAAQAQGEADHSLIPVPSCLQKPLFARGLTHSTGQYLKQGFLVVGHGTARLKACATPLMHEPL